MGKSRRAGSVKDVVIEIGVFGPAVPVCKKKQVYRAIRAGVDGVVVNERVFDGTGYGDAARSVIPADVITDNRCRVAGALGGVVSAFITNEKESAIVVVRIVVLNHRAAAVPVGVETFAITLAFGAIRFVALNHCVVGAPGPDGDVVIFRPLNRVAHDIILN